MLNTYAQGQHFTFPLSIHYSNSTNTPFFATNSTALSTTLSTNQPKLNHLHPVSIPISISISICISISVSVSSSPFLFISPPAPRRCWLRW